MIILPLNLLENVFSFLLHSNSMYAQSKENKQQYSILRLVCKEWSDCVSQDLFWKVRASILPQCKENYFNYIIRYAKALFDSKLEYVEENPSYKFQFEIINSLGQLIYYTFGPIVYESISNEQTRIGIKKDSSVVTNSIPIEIENLKNVRIKIIIHYCNKFALLFDSTSDIVLSLREPGGYFNLPVNTKFASSKKITYLESLIKAYVCFDLIKYYDLYQFHSSTNKTDKYNSSLAFLLGCKIEDTNIFFRNLNWKTI